MAFSAFTCFLDGGFANRSFRIRALRAASSSLCAFDPRHCSDLACPVPFLACDRDYRVTKPDFEILFSNICIRFTGELNI